MKIDCYGKLKRCLPKKGGLNKRVGQSGSQAEWWQGEIFDGGEKFMGLSDGEEEGVKGAGFVLSARCGFSGRIRGR